MADTILMQGKFTADGAAKTLAIRSDLDWIRVYNETALAQGAADLGAEFYYQRGMTAGRGVVYTKLGTVANDPMTIGQIAAGAGFTLVNQGTDAYVSSAQATTGVSNATNFVVNTAATNVAVGDIVLLSQTAAQQAAASELGLTGIPFQVAAINAGVSFTVVDALSQAPGAGAAAAGGSFRKVSPYSPFLPSLYYIGKIDVGTPTAPVVYTTTAVPFTVGQKVQLNVPSSLNGMVEANGLEATVTAVAATGLNFTLDLDTTGFTAFAYPTLAAVAAAGAFTPAHVVPVGMNTAQAITDMVDILADAEYNSLIIGVKLAAGNASPAGNNNDVIYWVAGKSFSVSNS